MTAPLTDADLASIEARASAMLASADATERDEPDLAGLAAQIRGHARELAALAAEVRRLRSPWRDEPPTFAEVRAHSAATDAATGSTWGVWLAESTNTLGACPRVVLLRAMHDGGGVWAHVDGQRAVSLPDALAQLGAVRWLRWLFGPAGWSP